MAAPDRPAADGPGVATLLPGLVAHWRFDDPPGSTTAQDSTGNGNVGSLVALSPATSWVPGGRVGGAIAIPDSGGVVVLPTGSIETISGAFTIAGWTLRTMERAGLATVLSRRGATVPLAKQYGLSFVDGGLVRGFINTQLDPAPPTVTSSNGVALGRWVHLAFTYDGRLLSLHVDGVPAGTAVYDQPVVTGSTPICLGCSLISVDNITLIEPLGGLLDEVVLYSRALDAAEIRLLATGAVPASP